jgi:hypothetical protein
MSFQQYPQKFGIPSGNTAGRPSNPVIGDTYYNGELEILEIYNGTAWVAASAPPATPSLVSVTDASSGDAYSTSTAGKINVVLQQGSGGGTPSQYNVFTTVGGHGATSSNTSITITGLTLGTAYTVYGNAQNNFGTTVNTPNAAPLTPSTRPQVPTIGTATAGTSTNEITVTWTLGNNGGKDLSAITITPYLNGTTAQTSRTAATTTSTSYTFTQGQLTAQSSYTFKVKTTNANGDSPESSASNSATMPQFVSVEYVLLSGGGGGGGGETNAAGDGGGGGGAGGYKTGTVSMNAGTYSIEVGGGGAGDTTRTSFGGGTNGSLSRIHQSGTTVYSLTVDGGGAGGGNDGVGQNGGCGGGCSGDGASAGTGNAGGNGGGASGGRSGGGGGGILPANGGTQTNGGNGGAGKADAIKSISMGGGGAGGSGSNGNANGSASDGGGANANGTNNKGGGGGGARSGPNNGYNGGSGVVILKSTTQASATTGSPTATTSGSFYIYEFQSSGSITY